MNQQAQAADNRAWVRAKIAELGMAEPLTALAERIVAGEPRRPSPWSSNYCLAYSDGHNNRGLHGKRLDHYANAFADICEEVNAVAPELELTLEAFWLQWDGDSAYEGTVTAHWYLA